MEAERDSFYKAIGYAAKEKPYNHSAKRYLILSCVHTAFMYMLKIYLKPIILLSDRTADPETFPLTFKAHKPL